MTDTAPAPDYHALKTVGNSLQVPVSCRKHGPLTPRWITPEELEAMGWQWSDIDGAYLLDCGKCLYQRVDDDAPLKHQRTADPERTQHHRRKSGGMHSAKWHAEAA